MQGLQYKIKPSNANSYDTKRVNTTECPWLIEQM